MTFERITVPPFTPNIGAEKGNIDLTAEHDARSLMTEQAAWRLSWTNGRTCNLGIRVQIGDAERPRPVN